MVADQPAGKTDEDRRQGRARVITTGGAYLNDEDKGQSGGSNVVWNAGDDGNAESATQPVHGYRGTPPSVIVHAVPGFIRECRLSRSARGRKFR